MIDKGQRARQNIANTRALLEWRGIETAYLDLVAAQQDRALWRDCGEVVRAGVNTDANGWARWDLVGNHGATARRGWREKVINWPCQVIEHEGGLVEIDFDRMSPERGVGAALVHGIEVLWHKLTGRKTNSLDVAQGLRRRGVPVEIVT